MRNIYLNLIQNCAKHILKKKNSTNTAKFTKMKNKKIDEQNNKIKDYINTNYTVKGELTFVEQTNGVLVNCDGDIRVKNSEIESITNGSFRFGKVSGDFSCYSCGNLKSLKGAPNIVGGYFDCSYCELLKSLEGAPNIVDWHFDCSGCKNLQIINHYRKKYRIES